VSQSAAGSAGFFATGIDGNVCDVATAYLGNLDVFKRGNGIALAECVSVDGADFIKRGVSPADR